VASLRSIKAIDKMLLKQSGNTKKITKRKRFRVDS
jgi:hypothetical protein